MGALWVTRRPTIIVLRLIGDFLLDLSHSEISFSAVVGKRNIWIPGKEQYGGLVPLKMFPEVVGIGFGQMTSLTRGSRSVERVTPSDLREYVSIAFLQVCQFPISESFRITVGDLLAGLLQ